MQLTLIILLTGCRCEIEASRFELSDVDKSFLTATHHTVEVEIQLTTMARAKSDAAIKSVAEEMLSDFEKAMHDLQTISANTNFQFFSNLSDESDADVTALNSTTVDKFDSTFLKLEIKRLSNHITSYDKQVLEGTEPSVVAFAKKYLLRWEEYQSKLDALDE